MTRSTRTFLAGAAAVLLLSSGVAATGTTAQAVPSRSAGSVSDPPAAAARGGWSFQHEWAFSGPTDDVTGVAVSGRHVFVVGEGSPGLMRRYTKAGKQTGSWALDYLPTGIAAGPDGLLHVTERWVPGRARSSVFVYRTDGSRVRSYTLGEGVTWFPGDIAVDGQGNSYVSDTHDGTAGVHRFDRSGAYVGSLTEAFGVPLDAVEGVAVSADGTLYVADTRHHRIVRFAPNGTATQWGQSGLGQGRFMNPYGLTVLPGGNVLVIDAHSDRVQELTPDGRFVRLVGAGKLRRNDAVAADADGTVYVGGHLRSLVRGVATFAPGRTARTVVPKQQVRTNKRRARVTLRCRAGAPCRGDVLLKQGKRTLAKGTYRIAPGKRKTLTVKLTQAGRKAYPRTKGRGTKATIVVRPAGQKQVARQTRLRR